MNPGPARTDPWRRRYAWWLLLAVPAATVAAAPVVVLAAFALTGIRSSAPSPHPGPGSVLAMLVLLVFSGTLFALPWGLLLWAPRRTRWTVAVVLTAGWATGWATALVRSAW